MGKISPVSAKYIVHGFINIDGVVDKPDVIGAIFGQTEGLLGTELELRELQKSGKIGRIEVNLEVKAGKSLGNIFIPSSLDKAETSIVGAALETIQKIGPCESRIKIEKIEDVRISKRNYVIERAKELLKNLTDTVLPDSQEITDEVAHSVRMMEITEYGRDRLPAGPAIDESEEIIVVEGRADVLNLLKHGIKNGIGLNGTSVSETMKELGKQKILTVFVDGDRGGDLILKELIGVTEIDYTTKAPDGKEVEELTKKEIHKALRAKVAIEQAKQELKKVNGEERERIVKRTLDLPKKERALFKDMLENLIGTRGAYIIDKNMKVLGKVPSTELTATLRNLKTGIHAMVIDGSIDRDLVRAAEKSSIKYIVAQDSRINPAETRITLVTNNDLT